MNTQDLYPIIRQWLSVRPSRQHFRALLDYLQQHLELLDEDLISYIDTHLSDWPDEERMSNGFTFYNTPLFRLVRNLVFFRHLWRDDIPLSSLTHITHLNLSHNSVNQTLIDKLHTSPLLSHLRGLKYNGYGFKDHHIQALTEVPNFQNISSLELWNTGITNAALDALAQSSHSHGLRELNLYNNKGFDDGGILSLSKSTTLTHLHALNIGYNNITMTGIQALCHSPAMKELRTLKASNLKLGDPLTHAIASSPHLTQLEMLELHNNGSTPESLKPLLFSPNVQHLKNLQLFGNKLGPIGLEAIGTSPQITKLEVLGLDNTGFWYGYEAWEEAHYDENTDTEDEDFEDIVHKAMLACFHSPNVRHVYKLSLASNDIGLKDLEAIGTSTTMRSLRELDLSQTWLEREHCEQLAQSPVFGSLERLTLWNCGLDDECMIALSQSPYMNALREITFQENEITAKGCKVFVDAKPSAQLRKLHFANNQLGDEGVLAIANAPHLSQLTELDVGINKVGNRGAIALAESPYITELRELQLGDNDIGNDGIFALAASPNIHKLKTLFLKWNPFDPSALHALTQAIPNAELEHDLDFDDDDE
ncbi:MAG: hypothetical protein CL920_18675 [Deltaproteobacteria bacterium]|nr:hypothetical protein [Deltaproteobacteria bacterium]MBU50709.1 hypothetical protein [Deltaproteobacteria bacterium]